jgi:hypothetical protein
MDFNLFAISSFILNIFFLTTAIIFWVNFNNYSYSGKTIDYNAENVYYPNISVGSTGYYQFKDKNNYSVEWDNVVFDPDVKTANTDSAGVKTILLS